MIRSKGAAIGCILVCLAIAGLASSASAAVIAGQVGGGIHMQYGPQDAGGNYLGIASESYEALTDWTTGWWSFVTGATPDGGASGFVLLAFDPYTGEVWSQVPDEQQALGRAGSYTGHTPTIGLTGVDGGGNAISSDVAQADLARGYTENTIFVTSIFAAYAPYYQYGMLLNTSPDGGILASPGVPGVAGERALLFGGEEIRPYLAGDPAYPPLYDPTYGGDLTFDPTKTQGYNEWWYDDGAGTSGYLGHNGQSGYVGFEMDGTRGWMMLDFSETAAGSGGVRLTEYYFDVPEPATMSLLGIGGIAVLIRRRRK